jgi:NTP pyrophosphatase (non-canonical NTP hydrolase)
MMKLLRHDAGRRCVAKFAVESSPQSLTAEIMSTPEIASAGNLLVTACHGASKAAGWWTNPKTGAPIDANDPLIFTQKLCLIHSEVSEAMEGDRKDLMDDKLPHRKMAEVELADALIRICDLAGARGYDLGGAIAEKMAFNAQRADHKLENRASAGGKSY